MEAIMKTAKQMSLFIPPEGPHNPVSKAVKARIITRIGKLFQDFLAGNGNKKPEEVPNDRNT